MKRRDLISALEAAGCVLLQHGARHDIYHNPLTGRSQRFPVNERLARKIIKDMARSGEPT